jgi:hypothetical protein
VMVARLSLIINSNEFNKLRIVTLSIIIIRIQFPLIIMICKSVVDPLITYLISGDSIGKLLG